MSKYNKDAMLIRIDPEQKAQLLAMADTEGVSMSSFIRQLITAEQARRDGQTGEHAELLAALSNIDNVMANVAIRLTTLEGRSTVRPGAGGGYTPHSPLAFPSRPLGGGSGAPMAGGR